MHGGWIKCEPDNGSLLDERRKAVFAVGRGIDYFNTYSLMHSTGLYENWRKDIPGKRAFFLIRQAFAGQQRNAATLWSSDITCTWNAFRSQIHRELMPVLQVFLTGLPILAATIFTGRLPIGRLRAIVSYLPDGSSSELSARFSEYTGKGSVLYSPTTGTLPQNLYF